MLTSPLVKDDFSLEDFMANPPDRMEWVDGQLFPLMCRDYFAYRCR